MLGTHSDFSVPPLLPSEMDILHMDRANELIHTESLENYFTSNKYVSLLWFGTTASVRKKCKYFLDLKR